MLRLLLPPNFTAAVGRDAVAVRVELDLSTSPPASLLPACALLQKFGVPAQPISLVQLTRAQLRELVQSLTGEKVFFRPDRSAEALAWNGLDLPGVSEHLVEKPTIKPVASPVPAASARIKSREQEAPPAPMVVDGSEHYLAITLPSRDSVLHEPALALLREHRFVLDPLTRKWWLRDRHKTLNFLAQFGDELRERFGAEFTPNFDRNTVRFREAQLKVAVAATGADYEVSVGLDVGALTPAQINAALAAGRSYIEDGAGGVHLVSPAQLERLQVAQQKLADGPAASDLAAARHRVSRARASEVDALLEELSPHYQAPESWRAQATALRDMSALTPAPVPAWFAGQLRPYQQLGVAWLWYLWRQKLGGILADEMGLGKTPQALALLAAVTATNAADGHAPHLVVVPASLMENWRREAARFTPRLRVFVHHGQRRLAAEDFVHHDLVLTSYGTLARDAELFAGVEFQLILADEAQHLKNRRTQAARSLRMLRGRGRFLLTGTPLENSLDDLRSLFDFLMPGFLPRAVTGGGRDERVWHDERLRTQTAPYILRRTKAVVATELPPKLEQVIYCEPTERQARLYRDLQREAEQELYQLATAGAGEGRLRLATLTQLLRLRQVCCDPRLVKSGTALPPEASAKLEAFRELLAECLDEGHRLLVFSQFTSLLDLLGEELTTQEVEYCRLDGSMAARRRQAEVDRFQADDTVPVFLISLKAGGTGLNLTGADVVVHFDPWWNPAAEAQATDRAHRIGQTKIVTSYKLICAGTVEERVQVLQESKRALLADVFAASDAAAAKLNLADLRDLLGAENTAHEPQGSTAS